MASLSEPNPGKPLLHRLNRAEYANSIHDLLDLEVDSAALLPPDDSGYGFDNNGDVLSLPPLLMEKYLAAALPAGGDYADLYFEYLSSTSLMVDESMVKSASQGVSAGCGVRVVSGERTGYAYTDDLSADRLLRAARTAALIASGPTMRSSGRFTSIPVRP